MQGGRAAGDVARTARRGAAERAASEQPRALRGRRPSLRAGRAGDLYTSNRGHDSIAVFRVGEDGALTTIDHTSTGGAIPRNFDLTPSGDRLIVANQASNTVVSFTIDPVAGTRSSRRTLLDTSAAPFLVGLHAIPAE
jgi:hypothetical protein